MARLWKKKKNPPRRPGKRAWGAGGLHPAPGAGRGGFQEQAVCTTASVRPSVRQSEGPTQGESRRESSATPLCPVQVNSSEEARGPSGRLPSESRSGRWACGPHAGPTKSAEAAFVRSFLLCLAVGSSPRVIWEGDLRWEISGQLGGRHGGCSLGSQDGQGEGRSRVLQGHSRRRTAAWKSRCRAGPTGIQTAA